MGENRAIVQKMRRLARVKRCEDQGGGLPQKETPPATAW